MAERRNSYIDDEKIQQETVSKRNVDDSTYDFFASTFRFDATTAVVVMMMFLLTVIIDNESRRKETEIARVRRASRERNTC